MFKVDNRKGENTENDNKKDSEGSSTIIPEYNEQNLITIDGNESGHNNMQRLEGVIENGDIYELPMMKKEPKLLQKETYKSKAQPFKYPPKVLSDSLGGKDVGGTDIVYTADDENYEISQQEMFYQIKSHFGNAFFEVKDYLFEDSILKKKVGVIQINTDKTYYYYVVIFGVLKRGGFLHKSNFQMIDNEELKSIVLKSISEVNGNWSRLKKAFSDAEKKKDSMRENNLYIIIHPRNQESAKAVFDLCMQDIKQSKEI